VIIEYPQGHNLVIVAFEVFKKEKSENFLFESLVRTLHYLVESRGHFGSIVGSQRDGTALNQVGLLPDFSKKEFNEFMVVFKFFLVVSTHEMYI
jgi:hypothetical protein